MTRQQVDTAELNRRIGLLALAEKDTALSKKGAKEYAGPCPFCGGHDRFNVQADRWLCRACTDGKWRDPIEYAMRRHKAGFLEVAALYLGADAPAFDPTVAAERDRQWRDEQARKAGERAERLKDFTTAELWSELHERMADEHRQQWRSWGIPDSWQNYLELGYTPDKPFRDGETLQHSPAYTIPYFHSSTDGNKKFATMQYRLVNAPNPTDRYRFEYGLGTTFYETTPTRPIDDLVIICEGAKKAAVLRIHGGANEKTTVLGVPSKSDAAGVVEAVKDSGRVYIVLDPDGAERARKLAHSIGAAARVVSLHGKVDDLILLYGMDKTALRQAFRWAERAQ